MDVLKEPGKSRIHYIIIIKATIKSADLLNDSLKILGS